MFTTTGRIEPFSACPADMFSAEGNVAFTDLDSAGGQSGSAVWDGEPVIRAVLVGGNSESTKVRAITKAVFNWLQGLAE